MVVVIEKDLEVIGVGCGYYYYFCPKIDVGMLSGDDSSYQSLSPIRFIILLILGLGPI